MRTRLRQRLDQFSVVGAALAVVEVALVGFLLWGIGEYRGANSARRESSEIVMNADAVRIALLDAQAGSRGYLVTGAEPFREQFRFARDRAIDRFDELEERVADDASQRVLAAGARTSAESALELMQQTVDLRRGEDFDLTAAAELELQVRALRDGAHAELVALRGREAARLDSRTSHAERLVSYNALTAVALALVTPIILAWFLVAIRQHQERRALRLVAEAREEFVGFVSHELRSPMAIISGNARLLADSTAHDPEAGEAVGHIADATARMEGILGTLLTLVQAEGGVRLEFEPLLVQRLAARMARLHRARFPERVVEVEADSDVPPATGDRHAVEQILVNLLSNAEKYSSATSPIIVKVAAENEAVRVSVSNFGASIQSQDLPRMFEPYVRADSASGVEGLGLGLAVCQRLVTAQKGAMSGEVGDEGLVTFWFTLPVDRGESGLNHGA